ncbi:MAG: HDIG domain-containing protein, partial [Deltaproteobacteria bacterium]
PERVKFEMDLLLGSHNSAAVLRQMEQSGLLYELFPLLREMEGVRQPLSHHLDVLNHSLATLQSLEGVLAAPTNSFPECPSIDDYLRDDRKKVLLKWAALLHDCGKPQTRCEREGRITFYNHDRIGATLFEEIAAQYRWSRKDTALVSVLIGSHMWPFHLNNVYRQQKVSKRACLRLAKRLKTDLPGLFLLAMADSLAGKGPEKPAGIEDSLVALYRDIDRIYRQELSLQMAAPPLITGHDLIEVFDLKPGPIFKEILDRIRDAQLCSELENRQQALQQVQQILKKRKASKMESK